MKLIIFIIILILLLIIYLYHENTSLKITNYNVKSNKLPSNFNNFKIAHISDFHNEKSKRINRLLINALKKNKPDIIVITGDLIHNEENTNAIALLPKLTNIAPTYYVSGNHESTINNYDYIIKSLKNNRINILNNKSENIKIKQEFINIIGVDDPALSHSKEPEYIIAKKNLKKINYDKNTFTILLSHRPELFDLYVEENIDLSFSGHAHGGQFRLPFIGGVYSPSQGLFPKYSEGIHLKNKCMMIVSRGIGNSSFPFRLNNRPELVFATLKKDNE